MNANDKIISGKEVAKEIKKSLQKEISELHLKCATTKPGIPPGIAFVLVGEDPASQVYVRMKSKTSKEIGIFSKNIELPADIAEKALLKVIEDLNHDPTIHGILVQMPLPKHLDACKIIEAINPNKDVDGFHPLNIGRMVIGDENTFISCTPFGILKLLEASKIETSGKEVVILGRSNIVGRPLANLLSQKRQQGNATVTLLHSHSRHIDQVCKRADILIAAIGSPKFVTASMVKPGAIVIDVGINRTEAGLVGDVDFEAVLPICSRITPVPGGVGPMTIIMLLYNTLQSYKRSCL